VQNIEVGARPNGALVSLLTGVTTSYAIGHLEDRGILFVSPRTNVYEGMIVGMSNKNTDLTVNIVQEKQLGNQRSATKDNTVVLRRPLEMNLEKCLAFLNDDELIEVTPINIRLRKLYLSMTERRKHHKSNDQVLEEE
jgi:GTP-binding protein